MPLPHKLLDIGLNLAVEKLKSVAKEHISRVSIDRRRIEESLDIHMRMVDNWSSEVKFKDLSEAKWISKIYVKLDYFLTPSSLQYSETSETIRLDEILEMENNVILLGQPGAGKTTSMKYICQKILFDENYFPDEFAVPIVIRFREIDCSDKERKGIILFSEIFNILGLNVKLYDKGDLIEKKNSLLKKSVISFLDSLPAILILDGFDEIQDYKASVDIIKEVELLSIHLKKGKLILTSRTGEFYYTIGNSREFEICALNEEQIIEFTEKWLNDISKAKIFFTQLKNSPFFDTMMRPLTLAHLTAIYEREGKIPEKPKTVYKKVVNLLLEEWNIQRGIRRQSKFSNFEVDRKFDFLSYLAYELTSEYSKSSFDTSNLEQVYFQICSNFGLEEKDVNEVVKELESHTGLFIQTGYELFQFPHKSIQEYLTAEFLVKSYTLPDMGVLLKMPNELALGVAISSIPSDYFAALILNQIKEDINQQSFIEPFINTIVR